MTTDFIYDIRAFCWNGKTRTFTQDVWNLEWMYNDSSFAAFPNMRQPFFIRNYNTGEERLFTFLEEKDGGWVFENAEDNITCIIGVDPF